MLNYSYGPLKNVNEKIDSWQNRTIELHWQQMRNFEPRYRQQDAQRETRPQTLQGLVSAHAQTTISNRGLHS